MSIKRPKRLVQRAVNVTILVTLLVFLSYSTSAEYPTNHQMPARSNERGKRHRNNNGQSPHPAIDNSHELLFMEWCRNVLGIQTVLEIQTFQYYDYMKALSDQLDWDDEQQQQRTLATTNSSSVIENLPMISVRGLAASRDIEQGEVVIRIPLQALFSVTTTIDQDPILSSVMGPDARTELGWDIVESRDEANNMVEVEVPLLAVALLHHKKLGAASPLAPYLTILQETSIDSIPYLWSPSRLKSLSEGIRTVARTIQREMEEMYESVVKVLIAQHPDLFGKKKGEVWMFSYEQFQWAFAMVNSRHWQLPVSDFQPPIRKSVHRVSAHLENEQIPPADMPTDTWVKEQYDGTEDDRVGTAGPSHSFLAPVADLLNFGPPCTRGRYNEDLHAFEIIASCDFRRGQEVTFWYSDECDHIIVGVYGFTHPLVPPCPTAEEYRRASEFWKERAQELEVQLSHLDADYSYLQRVLDTECACCNYSEKRRSKSPHSLRHEHVRGSTSSSTADDVERRGVRKMRRERNSEF